MNVHPGEDGSATNSAECARQRRLAGIREIREIRPDRVREIAARGQ
ncbi:hypothetical protein [Rhodococcus olei]